MVGDNVVLGIGNPLWADDGIGLRLLDLVRSQWDGAEVEWLDGGTQGLYLLPHILNSRHLLVLDAVDLSMTAGTVLHLEEKQIETAFRDRPLSLHQTGLQDLLAAARLLGWQPASLSLVGIQVENIDQWGGSLSSVVQQSLPQAAQVARQVMQAWDKSRFYPQAQA